MTNPAETGTLLLEFGTLSKLTSRPVFFEKAKRALVETFKRRSPLGLVGQSINVETGAWTNTDSHISGGIDSYYEYLWKCWLLFGDKDCRDMWEASIPAINKYLADERRSGLWYGHADMQTGKRTETTYGALDAFFPALLALSGDLARARRLQASSFKMWNLYGIEPEFLITRRCAWSPEVIISVPRSLSRLIIFIITQATRSIGIEARKCSMTLSDIAARIPATLRLLMLRVNNSSTKWRASSWLRLSVLLFALRPGRNFGVRESYLQYRSAPTEANTVKLSAEIFI